MKISIVIPTYHEALTIEKTVSYIRRHGGSAVAELIVSDGGSTDQTLAVAEQAGALAVLSPRAGRAAQMNYGARIGTGEVLYFIHADCMPPKTFVQDITTAIRQGYGLGRYTTRFDSNKTILKLNAWFTRFDLFICMGGDQTLFVKRSLFDECGGFREDMKIMEEYEFCHRARTMGRYRIMKGAALVSARKYDTNSWLRVQLANSKIVRMFRKGASQEDMVATYKKMLQYRNNAF